MKTKASLKAGLVLSILLSFMPTLVRDCYSAEFCCEVIAVKDNAWLVRRDASVKSSLRPGDVLYKGDRIDVMRGNSVDLAFDKARLNVIHVEGDAVMEISRLYPTYLDLSKGKLFALLDNLSSDRRFKILTPTATAAVRGTQFKVQFIDQISKVFTYQGSVQVAGRDITTGLESKDTVILGPNEKTSVTAAGRAPEKPAPFSEQDASEIEGIRTQASDARAFLDQNKIESPFGTPQGKDSNDLIQNNIGRLSEKKSDKEQNTKGKIVI